MSLTGVLQGDIPPYIDVTHILNINQVDVAHEQDHAALSLAQRRGDARRVTVGRVDALAAQRRPARQDLRHVLDERLGLDLARGLRDLRVAREEVESKYND